MVLFIFKKGMIDVSFKMKYPISSKYLGKPSKRRGGDAMSKVVFIVAHDTGNPNSTAAGNINYYQNSRNEVSASAHLFVDDKEIIECIPTGLLELKAEKAWHVLYNVTTDNKMYGVNANDCAIGVEYCFGSNINSDEAYAKFIWVMAYLCYFYKLDPAKAIVGHHILDPGRKIDPKNGLSKCGRTYEQMLKDVVTEYKECTKEESKGVSDVTQDEKVHQVQNQIKYLYSLSQGPDKKKADWANACLLKVYDSMKEKKLI